MQTELCKSEGPPTYEKVISGAAQENPNQLQRAFAGLSSKANVRTGLKNLPSYSRDVHSTIVGRETVLQWP